VSRIASEVGCGGSRAKPSFRGGGNSRIGLWICRTRDSRCLSVFDDRIC